MIVPLTWEIAVHIATHLRESDYDEVMSNRWDGNQYSFASEVMRTPGVSLACVTPEGVPVAMGGIALYIPGVGQAWLVGTDECRKYSEELHTASKTLMDRLFSEGRVHRIQAFSAVSHRSAHRWIKRCGLRQESRMASYGKNREDFLTFSVIKGD